MEKPIRTKTDTDGFERIPTDSRLFEQIPTDSNGIERISAKRGALRGNYRGGPVPVFRSHSLETPDKGGRRMFLLSSHHLIISCYLLIILLFMVEGVGLRGCKEDVVTSEERKRCSEEGSG